jgi:hypothetical protein
MDTRKGLQAVQVAQFQLRQLYLGDRAGDELAVAETPVPACFAELSAALHTAAECLADEIVPWGEQAVEFRADGAIRLKQLPTYAPAL